MGEPARELCEFCSPSWELCSPGCVSDQRVYIETLNLSIFKLVQQKLSTFSGPPTLRPAPLFGLGSPANSSIVMTEWYPLLL